MKIISVILFLKLFLFSIPMFSQENLKVNDIYLNDGSFIRGEIIEKVENQYIRIKISGGNIVQFSMNEIKKVTAIIPCFNEENTIAKCIESVLWADEILVVDSFSTDRTKEICEKHDVRFIKQKFLGYKEQKNFAMSKARFNYILSVDGDEALSEQLKNSILEIKNNWTLDGYYCNRLNNYCGQWIKYSDWYPDRKLRLFKKNTGEWKGINPHDSFKLYHGRKSGRLKGDLLHWIYRDYKEHKEKVERFSSIAAQSYYDLGIKSSLVKIIWRPSWAFLKAYLFRRGFLDGKNGWLISKETFNVTYLKYTKLRKIWKTEKLIKK